VATKLELTAAIKQYRCLLLDTNLLIDEFKRHVNVLAGIPRPQRFTSLVAVWEFVHLGDGQLIAHVERTDRRNWMERHEIRSVWLSSGSEQTFRNLLWHTGGPRGVADRLLAAESISRKWPLVTRNVKDFDDVDGLMIVPY
jgi:predicted nucleic acid-binding protein